MNESMYVFKMHKMLIFQYKVVFFGGVRETKIIRFPDFSPEKSFHKSPIGGLNG